MGRDNPSMRILIDFFPIALFFAAYKYYDIYTGTAVLMAATVVQTGLIYAIDRKLQTMQKVTFALILAFGSLTLALHDERFIKWKPTVLYVAMALAMSVAMLGWKKNLMQILLGTQLVLPEPVWRKLTLMWIGFFLFLAAANAYVVLNFSTEFWVSFKLWGYAFWVPFFIWQATVISPHMRDDPATEDKP